jgi:hypothetical protein
VTEDRRTWVFKNASFMLLSCNDPIQSKFPTVRAVQLGYFCWVEVSEMYPDCGDLLLSRIFGLAGE